MPFVNLPLTTRLSVTVLLSNTSGGGNTATGAGAHVNNTGFNNTASGPAALANNTDGSNNIAFGLQPGNGVTTASNVICIGA
jgi:hypothetical protein